MRTEIEELRGQLETEKAKVKAFRMLWEDAEARIEALESPQSGLPQAVTDIIEGKVK